MGKTHTNDLIHEHSPYLQQHAHNPVDWKPWSEATLAMARNMNKPILVSIGYSACHWCHVMEHESFESEEVAAIMNEHFICIKVDREERPDVDHVYMDAVQLISGQGGWPLNCFALPDGRPFFGGTYFPKAQWMSVLSQIAQLFRNDRAKLESHANSLHEGMQQMDRLPLVSVPAEFDDEVVDTAVARWQKHFDWEAGGMNYSPKFPMPTHHRFLLHYGYIERDDNVLRFTHLTLRKMAMGGIYDQIGGGFTRYSTDAAWKVPHFEKMLYDNGQLLSLYAVAYAQAQSDLYRATAHGIVSWAMRELFDPERGVFFSALDADSEGEEGRYYTWSEEEIATLSEGAPSIIRDYYNFNEHGLWEGRYIPLRRTHDAELAARHNMSEMSLRAHVEAFRIAALQARAKRPAPSRDHKVLTSWNAMMVSGLCRAGIVFHQPDWIATAAATMQFILTSLRTSSGGLLHQSHSEKSAYLDGYAFTIEALLQLHAATAKEVYLQEAFQLAQHVFGHFQKNDNGFFHFNAVTDAPLVVQKVEIQDNVIPSSNSVLAISLLNLARIYMQPDWEQSAKKMLAQLEPLLSQHPGSYSEWMQLHLMVSQPFFEVAVVGEHAEDLLRQLGSHYLPNTVLCGCTATSDIPLLQDRYRSDATWIYVCRDGACQLPVTEIKDALSLIR